MWRIFSETDYDQWADMEGLKSSELDIGESSREGGQEEKEEEKKVEEVGDNNNCLPSAVTMDEMELLKKLEEANRWTEDDEQICFRPKKMMNRYWVDLSWENVRVLSVNVSEILFL